MLSARAASLRLLAALLGFGILAATIVLAVEWQRGSARAIGDASRTLDDRADDVAEHVARDVQERVRAMRAWAALDVAQELAVDDLDKRLSAALRELARDLGAADLAVALDGAGRIVAASDALVIGQRVAARFPALDSLRAAAVITDSARQPWFAVVEPVVRHDGVELGRLALLSPWDRLGSSGLAAGTLARLRLDAGALMLYRGAEVGLDSTDAVVRGHAVRMPASGVALDVTLVAPREEVLAPVRAARRVAVLAAAAVLLVLVPVALLLTRTASRALARQEALATMGSMAAGLAHEIRTPLGVVRTSLDLLARGGDAARRDEITGIVREETARLERLVDDLLAFARPRTPQRVEADLAAIVRAATALLASLCERHGARLECELEPAPTRVDAELVRQVLLNLVDNGARAAGAGGVVVLTVRPLRDGAELSVRDSGPGVPGPMRDRLWDPFVTSRSTGTGLGLAIVRRIVEAHGGAATLVSPPGTGADFRLSFPAT